MRWEDCNDNKKVRKASPDESLIKSLLEMSANKIKVISSLPLNETTASVVLVEYYEALREVAEAIASKNGFKVYSHECLTSMLQYLVREEIIAQKFDRFRKLRNGINYYGKPASLEEARRAVKEIPSVIDELKTKHLKEFI